MEDLSLSSKAVIASVIVSTRFMDLRVRRVRVRQDAFFRESLCRHQDYLGKSVNELVCEITC